MIEKFKNKIIKRNKLELFTKEDALSFINECEKNSIVIFGIDGFYLTEKTIQPSMENSLDFGNLPLNVEELVTHKGIYYIAETFLNNTKDEKLYFEIVYDENQPDITNI